MTYINGRYIGSGWKVHGRVHVKGVWCINGWHFGSFTTCYKVKFCTTQSESFSHSHQISECIIKHMSNSHECMGVSGEALHLPAVYKKVYLNYKSHKNLYQ